MVLQVPLPQEPLQGGSTGGFRAPAVAPVRSATGRQLQQFGRGLEAAGGTAADIANRLQNDLDNARTKEAYTLWNDQIREALNDPQSGYLTKKGKNATGEERSRVQQLIAERAESIGGQLDNEVQRGMFRQIADRRTFEVTQQMDRHEATQIQVYQLGETKTMLEAAAGDSIEAISIGDVQTFQIHKNNALEQARVLADGMGFGPEQTKDLLLETTTQIHIGVVERLISEDRGSEAASYLQGVDRDELQPEERSRLNNRVNRASLNDRASRMAFDLIDDLDRQFQQETTLPVGQGLEIVGDPTVEVPEDVLVDRAREVLEQRFRDNQITEDMRVGVLQRIEEEARARSQGRAVDANDARARGEEWLQDNPNKGVSQMPPDLYEDLQEAGELGNIQVFSRQRRYSTDWEFYGRVLDRDPSLYFHRDGTPRTVTEFIQLVRPHLADAEFKQALAGHANISKPSGQVTEEDRSVWSDTERIKFALDEAGITDDTDRGLAQQAIQQLVNQELKAGRPAKGTAMQPLIDSVLMDRVIQETSFFFLTDPFGGEGRAAAFLTPEEVAEGAVRVGGQTIRLAAIPPQDRAEIIAEMERQGIPVTQTGIAEAFVAQIRAARGRPGRAGEVPRR